MSNDASSANDTTMVNNLPSGTSFSTYLNRTNNNPNGAGSATAYLDNDGDANNTTLRLNNANAKAVGLLTADLAAEDANITFNSDFSWDFDQSDGIGAGLIDFVGVAIHEIGHAMGFTSGVDILDIFSPPAMGGPYNDDQFTFVTALDFTRFSADSESAGADIDWTADTRAKYFSIDGGATAATAGTDHWSTGLNFGDGRQASHWKDNLALGIMDPTAVAAGSVNVVTALDLLALDVVGWNNVTAVPEPSSLTLLTVIAVIGLGNIRRRPLQKHRLITRS